MLRITLESDGMRRLEWIACEGSAPFSLCWRSPPQRSETSNPNRAVNDGKDSLPSYALRVLGWLEIVGRSRR
jgi:hypothetical protein